jgi:hypothetical protein
LQLRVCILANHQKLRHYRWRNRACALGDLFVQIKSLARSWHNPGRFLF